MISVLTGNGSAGRGIGIDGKGGAAPKGIIGTTYQSAMDQLATGLSMIYLSWCVLGSRLLAGKLLEQAPLWVVPPMSTAFHEVRI